MSILRQKHGILQQTVKKSVTIDAENQSLDYGTSDPFGTDLLDTETAFTFSCWWKPSDITNQGNFYSTHLAASPFRGISLSNRGGSLNQLRFYMIDDGFPGDTLRTDFNHNMTNGNWYHVVVTYNGGQDVSDARVFVDGVELVRDTTNDVNSLGGSAITTDDLTLFNGNLLGGALPGNFTEITWWDADLSTAQVSALYNSGNPPNPRTLSFSGNLLQWLRIDEDEIFFPASYDSQRTIDPSYINIPVTNITTDVP